MRQYEETHPWIDFELRLDRLTYKTWLLLGEAESKCSHIAGVPLRPEVATRLHEVYVSKGVHGTTSIEGNTLSEDEVLARVQGKRDLPPSLQYLGDEVDNILDALNLIGNEIVQGESVVLTPERIKQFNAYVLDGLEVDEGVVPGEFRTHSVGVARYKAAPAKDVEYLVTEMCAWLNKMSIDDTDMTFALAILKAIMAHLYIAWIHPFGDGNGRTARLVEFQLMIAAGIPFPAAHLLSNFYNRTREAYYRELDRTSHKPYSPESFIHYALRGFVDELREQLKVVRLEQMRVTWINYVHEQFKDLNTEARRRQKLIVLDFPENGEWVPISQVPKISTGVALAYGGKGGKTITRDVNALEQLGLIERQRGRVRANRKVIRAFLPKSAKQPG